MKTEKSITEIVASLLVELRAAYTEAVCGLVAERESLEQESAEILKTADELRLMLPARAREAQRVADTLLLSGKYEEAELKRQEQQQAERAPAEMEQRRATIASRIEEIDAEKRKIARRVFEEWFPGLRAALVEEQRTMCEALDNAWEDIQAYARETGTGGLPYSLVTANTRGDLTAREHGPEKPLFEALQNWFGFGGRQ
ncbi:MAG: hypothetical protein P4K93_09355 [Terracidiphilus sp.]|nr:hypothetical protein [Terracidiphilus sp.]MDR3798347.1 hypothetical protein [Terracidiphilus sp.]